MLFLQYYELLIVIYRFYKKFYFLKIYFDKPLHLILGRRKVYNCLFGSQ